MLPMHPYQVKASQFCKDKKFAYLAIDMGMGKTRVAIEWAGSLSSSTLVLGPLRTIQSTWPEEIEKWSDKTYQVLHGPTKGFNDHKDFYLMNYEGLAWLYPVLLKMFKANMPLPFRSMIIDEGSMVKSPSTKRFKLLKVIKDVCKDGVIILSGTPAPNSLLDLWAQYYILDSGERLGSAFTGYKNTYFMPIDRMGFTWKIKSDEHADLIHKKIADNTYRLKAEDYLSLPECIFNTIAVELPPKVLQQIKTIEKDFLLSLDDKTIAVNSAPALGNKIRQMIQGGLYTDDPGTTGTRAYHVLHLEKLKVLKSLVEEANGQGILCAIQYKFELDMILKEFPKASYITSKCSGDANEIIKSWNKGDIPLLICHPRSLSHGVNLQAGSHIIVWYCIPWSLEQWLQLNKRLHRQGQKNAVVIHSLVAKNTMDKRVVAALQTKEATQDNLLEFLRLNLM